VVESTMDLESWLRKQLEQASPDLLRAMVQDFAQALMGAEADALCGADYGERAQERINRRNGYRERDWDTRVGSIELAVPKLRTGSYFPDWLLQPRRRAEQAFVSVIAGAYLGGVSTRRVEKLVQQLGVERMSKSQVSRLARSLDAIVEDFRTRPLEGAPYPYLVVDALEVKCREGGRTVNACVVHAVAVNRDGFRESLGLDVVTSEDGAAWLAFLRSLVARGLGGVRLVTSDAHPGLVDAIAAALPGAAWQRCQTHFMRNLLTRVPKSAQGFVATMVRSIFAQPDAESVARAAGPHRRSARGSLPGSGDAARRSGSPDPRLHRLPQGALASAVVEQLARAAQQGDPPPHRRRRHLPSPSLDRPPRRRPAGRAARRMGRRPPLHERRVGQQGARPATRRIRGGDGDRAQLPERQARMARSASDIT
jgi:putative transposase